MHRRTLLFLPAGLSIPLARVLAADLPPPAPLGRELGDDAARRELQKSLERLCDDITAVESIIDRSGMHPAVDIHSARLSGLSSSQFDLRRAGACGGGKAGALEEVNRAREAQWFLSLRLRALAEVAGLAVLPPTRRPDGAVGDFLRLHEVITLAMREAAAPFVWGTPTLADGDRLAAFFRDVVLEHHLVEDRTLYPLVSSIPSPRAQDAANLLLAEHYEIAGLAADYEKTLAESRARRQPLAALAESADRLRGYVEMHFAKESEAVIKPLAGEVGEDRLAGLLDEQEAKLGQFLRGWHWARSGSTVSGSSGDAYLPL